MRKSEAFSTDAFMTAACPPRSALIDSVRLPLAARRVVTRSSHAFNPVSRAPLELPVRNIDRVSLGCRAREHSAFKRHGR